MEPQVTGNHAGSKRGKKGAIKKLLKTTPSCCRCMTGRRGSRTSRWSGASAWPCRGRWPRRCRTARGSPP